MQEPTLARDVIPGYELEGVRARGGMGTVYTARDKSDRQIALKVIRHDLSNDQRYQEQLKYEVQAARQITHPNVVRVLDAGEARGHTYVAMELVNGPTLAQEVAQNGALSVPDAVGVIAQIADALDAVHQQGLVHGDVSPSNILLSATARQLRRALLTDFGLARPAAKKSLSQADSWTSSGFPTGTPGYMSPEQQNGEGATVQTDIYNLGAVFYTTLVGKQPHAGSLANGHLSSLSQAIQTIVIRAMHEEPEERFQTAAEFAAALRSAATIDQPLPASTPPSLRRKLHRNRATSNASRQRRWAVAIGLMAVALLLLAGIGIARLIDIGDNQPHAQSPDPTVPARERPSIPTSTLSSITPPIVPPTASPSTSVAGTRSTPQPPEAAEGLQMKIDPSSFDVSRSRWNPYGPLYEGTSDMYPKYGVTHAHAYGNTVGVFVYQIKIEDVKGSVIELGARLSADAIGYTGPSNGYSDVVVAINGNPLPVRRVMPDDGKGVHYTWRFDATLLRHGVNQIEFRVDESAQFPNGLCIYGAAIAPGSVDEWITLRSE